MDDNEQTTVTLPCEVTKKGLVYITLSKKDFIAFEESVDSWKLQVINRNVTSTGTKNEGE